LKQFLDLNIVLLRNLKGEPLFRMVSPLMIGLSYMLKLMVHHGLLKVSLYDIVSRPWVHLLLHRQWRCFLDNQSLAKFGREIESVSMWSAEPAVQSRQKNLKCTITVDRQRNFW